MERQFPAWSASKTTSDDFEEEMENRKRPISTRSLAVMLFKKHARSTGIVMLVAAIALWFIAPYFHGHSDEAAWVQLFMVPTLVLCVIFGVLFAIFRKTTLSVLLILMLAAHLMVALGFHPH